MTDFQTARTKTASARHDIFAVFGAVMVAALVLLAVPNPARSQAPDPDIADAVVRVDTLIPGNARTARSLGQNRSGTGVIIDSTGLVLTIGYVMMEAEQVTITLTGGQEIPAGVVAYDHETGFGLVRTITPPDITPIRLGDSGAVGEGDVMLALSAGEFDMQSVDVRPVRIVSRRPFAGYWEYLLEEAIFTRPPVRMFGGAALVSEDGTLVGIGSLVVNDAAGTDGMPTPGNMFIPVNNLKPVLGDLLESGRRGRPGTPWLGVTMEEHRGHVLVARTSEGGPARRAGLQEGDIITSIDGEPVVGMVGVMRRLREVDAPEGRVQLDVLRLGEGQIAVEVVTMDRHNWLRLRPGN